MYEYQLVYRLNEQMSFPDSHTFEAGLKANSIDSTLTIAPRELRFTVERKRRVRLPEHAYNKDRVKLLSSALLLLSATSSVAPCLENEFQIITQGSNSNSYPLPEVCSTWWPSSYAEDLFLPASVPTFFQQSSKGRAIRSSIAT